MEEVYNVQEHDKYAKWLEKLKDRVAHARIYSRIMQIRKYGNFGKCKFFGDGVSELIIDHGSGYRVYYTMAGSTVVLLLCGGDKSTQYEDVILAKKLAKEVKSEREKQIQAVRPDKLPQK